MNRFDRSVCGDEKVSRQTEKSALRYHGGGNLSVCVPESGALDSMVKNQDRWLPGQSWQVACVDCRSVESLERWCFGVRHEIGIAPNPHGAANQSHARRGSSYTNFRKALTDFSNMVILVREPSELEPLGDTARRSVAPESTTTRDLVDVSS